MIKRAVCIALILLAPSAHAADCGERTPDLTIARCSAEIARLGSQSQTQALNLATAHQRRAGAYESKNMMKEAWADYDQAVALLPSFITFYNRGQFHADYGDPNIAINDLGAAIGFYERNPAKPLEESYAKALFHRAESLRRADRNAEAAADYDKAIARDPDDDILLFSRALALVRVGRHDEAIADLTEVLSLRRGRRGADQISALSNRSLAYMRKGDFLKALADIDEVIRREPDSVMAYVRRAAIQEAAGEPQKAIADLRRAQAMSPGLREVQDGLKRLGAS